jgi:ATP-dependent Clp protease ATP-binding subunit ClpA
MKKFPPLPIVDMLLERKRTPLAPLLGRTPAIARVARTIARKPYNNLLIIGKRGIGKSSLIQHVAQQARGEALAQLPSLPYLQLQTFTVTSQLKSIPADARAEYITAAFSSLPPCVMVIDDAERLLALIPDETTFDRIFAPFTGTVSRRLILVLEEEGLPKFKETYERCLKTFDTLVVTQVSDKTGQAIISQRATQIAATHGVTFESTVPATIYEASQKISSERSQPDRALRLFDEVCAAGALSSTKHIDSVTVETVVAQRLNLPSRTFSARRKQTVQNLPKKIAAQVIGQDAATELVTQVIQRGLLGLKNPHRPIGSFLFLGPSGVGKTELAKVIAKEVYGGDHALVRLDMSEFADSHTVARLIGAPPGYVGYEAGGQLTNPIKAQPFSLILLDEIEKAHPSIFDIFLQILDDGRLTDGQGQTVDFTQTIIIATSNIGIREIVSAAQRGLTPSSPEFMSQVMMPLLAQKFRLEFLNRFEGLAVFEPLNAPGLVAIARLEIKKIEERLSHHNIQIRVTDEELLAAIKDISDPHLGARPLKRFIEKRCEEVLAQQLLTT